MKVVRIRETERTPRGERRIALYLSESKLEGTAFWGYPYWFFDQKNQRRVRREIDFLVVIPERGLLILEVKDGGIQIQISANKGQTRANWLSFDHLGERHNIKAPDDQAEDGKWSVIALLKKYGCPPVPAGVGVCLSDTDALAATWIPPEILALKEDLLSRTAFENFLLRCIKFCLPTTSWSDVNYRLVCEALLPTTSETTSFRVALDGTSRQIDEASNSVVNLVQDQIDALSYLYGRNRGVVAGGAGTGKTLIALSLVKSLVSSGLRVLVLVPTKHLKEHIIDSLLRQGVSTFLYDRVRHREEGDIFQIVEDVIVATPSTLTEIIFLLHEKSRDAAKEEGKKFRRDEGSLNSVQRGLSLRYSADLSTLPSQGIFDALIVDETQDLPQHFVDQAMRFVRNPVDAPAYFFADFQQLRSRWITSRELIPLPWAGIVPHDAQIVSLGTNCRNPRSVGEELVRLKGVVRYHPLSPQGLPVRWVYYDVGIDAYEMGSTVQRIRLDLIKDGVKKRELLFVRPESSFPPPHEDFGYLKRFRSTGGGKLLSTDKVKGLEAPVVVVLIGPNEVINERLVSEIYVAFSRATSFMVVCCPREFQGRLDEYLRNQEG